MPLILFDFECIKCNHREEKLVQSDVRHADCPQCSGKMIRVVSPVRCKLEGHSGHFPSAAMKWERQHEIEGRKPSETFPDGW